MSATRLDNEQGASVVEYGLLLALLAASLVTIFATVGGTLDANFQTVTTSLSEQPDEGSAGSPRSGAGHDVGRGSNNGNANGHGSGSGGDGGNSGRGHGNGQ
ncbi:Flp family type IVb pilin [Nocardioides pakistanensis]